MSKFTVMKTKAGEKQKDYRITKIDTVARWFLWNKVAIDGKVQEKHDDYVKLLAVMTKSDFAEAAEFATTLAQESHKKTVNKGIQQAPQAKWFR